MTRKAIVKIVNINLETISSTQSSLHKTFSLCQNFYTTSAEVKCNIVSALAGMQTTKSFSSISGISFSNAEAEITMKLNQKYTLPVKDLSNQDEDRIVNLNGISRWFYSGSLLEDHEFNFNKLDNTGVMEAIIPPKGCFNMSIIEKISTNTVPYTALARVSLYESDGSLVSGNQLSSETNVIASDKEVSDNRVTVPISGNIDINVLEYSDNQLYPCGANN